MLTARALRSVPVARLREVLHYDASTGLLTWKAKPSKFGAIKVGAIAGCLNADGHRLVRVDGVLMLAHRAAWAMHYGEWPACEIDHRNEVKDDNRITNLRLCEGGILNAQNTTGPRRHNKIGVAGVVRSATKGERWVARIRVGGQSRHLGSFDTPEAAHAVYIEAKRRLHPAFAERGI